MENGIYIGTKISKESLEPLANAIIRIMEARADQETIRAALRVLSEKSNVSHVSISDVNITNTPVGITAECEHDGETYRPDSAV